MKNISVVLLFMILIGGINTGCSKDFPSYEEITDIYYENKELINSIKDGLFSSFIPCLGCGGWAESGYYSNIDNRLFLSYDYKNGQLVCKEDPQGEKLQSIQNVHSDVIEYFKRINRNGSSISFSKLGGILDIDDTRVVFSLSGRINYVACIVYTNNPDIGFSGQAVHIEGNWYAARYIFKE